jgi:hypothetical protein
VPPATVDRTQNHGRAGSHPGEAKHRRPSRICPRRMTLILRRKGSERALERLADLAGVRQGSCRRVSSIGRPQALDTQGLQPTCRRLSSSEKHLAPDAEEYERTLLDAYDAKSEAFGCGSGIESSDKVRPTCHTPANDGEPTPGLEPGTPSLRVMEPCPEESCRDRESGFPCGFSVTRLVTGGRRCAPWCSHRVRTLRRSYRAPHCRITRDRRCSDDSMTQFFTYGIFRSGEIAFPNIERFVERLDLRT